MLRLLKRFGYGNLALVVIAVKATVFTVASLPAFEEMFENFGAPLPQLTIFVLKFGYLAYLPMTVLIAFGFSGFIQTPDGYNKLRNL